MIKKRVIVTQIQNMSPGQVTHFQVRLPKNTKRIIGIETGFRLIRKSQSLLWKQ
jgi:hypothetical protein